MQFYSRINRPQTIAAPAGDEWKITYVLKTDDNGHKVLEESGKENIIEKINENLESTKIYNIIARFQNGDTEALNRAKGIYFDTTQVPKNLFEAQRMIESIEEKFMALPVEIRNKFDNNLNVYLAKMANGEGIEIIQKVEEQISQKEKIKEEAINESQQ